MKTSLLHQGQKLFKSNFKSNVNFNFNYNYHYNPHKISNRSLFTNSRSISIRTTVSTTSNTQYGTKINQIKSPVSLSKRQYSTRPDDSDQSKKSRKKVTLKALHQMYLTGTPISMLTAYDYHSAKYIENAGIDVCLVGDSLAMVACGYSSTNEIGMEEMLYHCRAVSRGSKSSFLLADMPFGSHQASLEIGVTNAIRMMREGGMEAVKVEGGLDVVPLITRLVDIGIPVMGHIGLMPQRQSALSGYRVQGKTAESALQITKDALALQKAGVFAIVLEALPEKLAQSVVSDLRIPTIGIGASNACAGQVLVTTDMLGMSERVPRFCRKYSDLATSIPEAMRAYHRDVKTRHFPESNTNTYEMPEEEWRRFAELRQTSSATTSID